MIGKSFLIVLFLLSAVLYAEDSFATLLTGEKGAIIAVEGVKSSDSVSLLQGVGYVELQVHSIKGEYEHCVSALPDEIAIDSIAMKVSDKLSLKVYSVLLEAESLKPVKRNGKALLLLSKSPVNAFQYAFDHSKVVKKKKAVSEKGAGDKSVTENELNEKIVEEKVIDEKIIEEKISEAKPSLDAIALYGRDNLIFVTLTGKELANSEISMELGKVFIDAPCSFMKKQMSLISGISVHIKKGKFYVSYDTSKASYEMKIVTNNKIELVFSDNRELENSQISYWSSAKDTRVISLPEVKVSDPVVDKATTGSEESVTLKNLDSTPAEEGFTPFPLYIIKNDANVRTTANTKGKRVAKLQMGDVVTAVSENGKWYEILLPSGDKGWIYNTLVKKESELTENEADKIFAKREEITSKVIDEPVKEIPVEEPKSEEPKIEEKSVYLIKGNVNIRTSPKTGSRKNIIGAFEKGTKLIRLEEKNNWNKVRFEDGKIGWVYATFVMDSIDITPEMWDSFYNSGKADDSRTIELAEKDSLKSSDETFDITTKPNVFKVTDDEKKSKITKKSAKKDEDSVEVASDKEPEKVTYTYKRYGRDPFLPLNVKNLAKPSMPKVDDLTLVGVIYSEARGAQNFALFEEKLKSGTTTFSLKEGENIEDGKLLHIEENRVVFLMREADFTYTVEKIMEKIDE